MTTISLTVQVSVAFSERELAELIHEMELCKGVRSVEVSTPPVERKYFQRWLSFTESGADTVAFEREFSGFIKKALTKISSKKT